MAKTNWNPYTYGVCGGLVAISTGIACCLILSKVCQINPANMSTEHYEYLKICHIITTTIGLILFVSSLFDLGPWFHNRRILSWAITFIIVGNAVIMIYATYVALQIPCKSGVETVVDLAKGSKTVFETGDAVGIIIFTLDSVATILLLATAWHFAQTY